MKRILIFFSALACLMAVLCPAALADSNPTLTAAASAAAVEPGDSFTVRVDLSGNPGLGFLGIEVEFNDAAMRLTKAENGSVFAGSMVGPYTDKSGAKMNWSENVDVNNTNNGHLVTLTFTAEQAFAPGTADITVKVTKGNAVNWDFEVFDVTPGTASVGLHGAIEWITVKEATCTEDGSREQLCSGCQLVLATETVPALGHSWDAGKVTREPTCTEAGETAYTCTVCGETKTEAIPALGHSWDAGKVTKEPTCTEAGETTYICTVCGETKTETIPALGHTWGEWETVTEPTVGGEGLRKHTCTVCGEVETETIPALEPEATPVPAPDNGSSGNTSPKTGDNTPVILYMTLAASCLLGAAALRRRKGC